MREIDKIQTNKSQKIDLKAEKAADLEPQFCGDSANSKETDLSTSPKALSGKAQVMSTKANIAKDLAFMSAHPDAVEKADKLCEMLEQNGMDHARASAISSQAAYEFFAKQ